MPQVNNLKKIIKKSLKEAELTVGSENTTFSIKVDVSNPQSETKLGIRIQLKPKSEEFLFTDQDKKGEVSVAVMKKLNSSLGQFDIQVSKDTDAETQDPTVLGFFIPLSQIKNMIVKSLGGTQEDSIEPKAPPTSPSPRRTPPSTKPTEPLSEEDPLDRAANLAKQPLPGYMSDMTGLGLKRSGYEQEQGGKISTKELFDKVSTVSEFLVQIWVDIVNESDYKFKEYLENNEDQYTRVGAVMAMVKDELEDRLESESDNEEKVEELKEAIRKIVSKENLNEMRVRDLNEASKIVMKEDFYNFINAGNNIIRTFEENGKTINEAKKYIKYLVAHNIM